MERISELQTKLKLLSTDYVEIEEYKFFEERNGCSKYDYSSNHAVFHDCRWGYVDRFENCSN